MLTAPIRVDLVGLPDVIRLAHAADELLTTVEPADEHTVRVPLVLIEQLAQAYEQLTEVKRDDG